MDPILVLRRTTAGDELVKHPRKIKKVEWRAVLLLVDGSLPVRELSRRFGESLNIEDVLTELLDEGLIEPAVHEPPSPFPDDLPEPRDPQWLARMEGKEVPPEAPIPPPPETIPAVHAPAKAPPPAAAKPAPVPEEEDEEEPEVELKPGRRIRFDKIGQAAVKVIALGLVAGTVAAGVLLPGHYKPDLEAELNRAFSAGVTVGSASLDFSGGPALALERVQIGGQGGINIPRMLLRPDYRRLLETFGQGIDARLPTLEINPTTLALLLENMGHLSRVTRITLDDLRLRMGTQTLPTLKGFATMPLGESPRLELRNDSGSIRVQAEANGLGVDFQFFADEWEAPVLGGFKSSGMQIDGRLTDQILEATHFGAAAMEGRLEGRAKLFFGPEIQVDGVVRTTGIEASNILGGFAMATTSGGRISGEFNFFSAGKNFSELKQTDRLSGQLRVDRGQFGGIDIAMALRERQPDAVTGGITPFDSLVGSVEYTADKRELQIDRLEAGSMIGSGRIRLAADESLKLQGLLQVEVSSGDRQVRAPVEIGGTLAVPNLRVANVHISHP